MDIIKIVKELKSGKLNRSIDEKYREGFWDLAGDIAYSFQNMIMEAPETERLQESIYNAFYEIAENCLGKEF